MSDSTSNFSSILDLPNEILMEIILYLSSGDRIALANTSVRFYRLLFEDTQLLRDLDLSQRRSLTCGKSLADIGRYFKISKRRRALVPKVKLLDEQWTSTTLEKLFEPPKMLGDVYTDTVLFETIVQLGIFIDPFVHLERLSIEWPGQVMTIGNNWDRFLAAWRGPFSRLRYLSVTMSDMTCVPQFLSCLRLCRILKELRIINLITLGSTYPDPLDVKLIEPLKSFEMVEFWGWLTCDDEIYNCVMLNLFEAGAKDLKQLRIDSELVANGLYFQKSIELPEMQEESKFCYISYDSLIKRYLTKTHEIEVGDLRCLLEQSARGRESLFRVRKDEIQLLLEGLEHKIHYLEVRHSIESDCIMHLVASAFPNLTELVLLRVFKIKESTPKKTHPKKRLRKKGDPEPVGYWNVNKDSSFKMLVENTPRLKNLTIAADPEDDEVWDLDALLLIAGWKNLRSLCLKSVPITDGQFLIEIGKQCRYLEKLDLRDLGPSESCCYLNELYPMLTECRSLRDFTIDQGGIGNISQMFLSLTNNRELERVGVFNKERDNRSKNLQLASPVEQLLRDCPKLTAFCFNDMSMSSYDMKKIRGAMMRLRDKLNRPNLRFEVINSFVRIYSDIVHEDSPPPYYGEDLMQYYFPETGSLVTRTTLEIWNALQEIIESFWRFLKDRLGQANSE